MLQSTDINGTPDTEHHAVCSRIPHRIAVFASEPISRVWLCRLLRQKGCDAISIESAQELLDVVQSNAFDLVILDGTESDETASDLCATIRSSSTVPIIGVHARSDGDSELDQNTVIADAYITKPFAALEVLSQVRSALSRYTSANSAVERPTGEHFTFDGWSYDPWLHSLTSPSGEPVDLTAAEHALLLTFVRHPHRALSRERLLEMTRARISHTNDRSVDMLVSRLRRKLQKTDAPPLIHTIRGAGYMLIADVTAS